MSRNRHVPPGHPVRNLSLSAMTEFEFGELFAFASQDAFSQFVSISTMLFAYLLAAHFVFRSLTPFPLSSSTASAVRYV